MTAPDWSPLRAALKACRASGAVPQVWWRDDDATVPTAALDQLTALAQAVEMPVHLAVIPANATPALAVYCSDAPLIPVVHGWAHADHSVAGEKKNEFLTARPGANADAKRGLTRLQDLFGPTLRPMFVPPWNRIRAEVARDLSTMGYSTLSTFGPRADPIPGITRINTHVDPIHWKGSRSLVDPQTLIDTAAIQLQDRLNSAADAAEPYGLLTHHLVHDPAIWAFAETFLTEMQMGGATLWQMET